MTRARRSIASVLGRGVAVALLIAWTSAHAGTVDPKLRRAAEEAFHAQRYEEALSLFEEASRQSDDAALLYDIARCNEELGRYAEAHGWYTRFAVEAPTELRARVPHLHEKIAELAKKTAVVTIVVEPAGATVSIGGKPAGTSGTLAPVRVDPGDVEIAAAKDGFRPEKVTIHVLAGATPTVRFALVDVAAGTLRLESATRDVTVAVDGNVVPALPTELHVSPGAHRVSATAKGYETYSASIEVPTGATVTHAIAMKRAQSSAWLWIGVGAVVVGGAIVTYAALTDRKADSGSFHPGQVTAGLLRF